MRCAAALDRQRQELPHESNVAEQQCRPDDRYCGVLFRTAQACLLTENRCLAAKKSANTISADDYPERCKASEDPAIDLSRHLFGQSIDRGDLDFGAFAGNELACYVWRALLSAPHIAALWVRTNSASNYAYEAFVHTNIAVDELALCSLVLGCRNDRARLQVSSGHRGRRAGLNLQAPKRMGCALGFPESRLITCDTFS